MESYLGAGCCADRDHNASRKRFNQAATAEVEKPPIVGISCHTGGTKYLLYNLILRCQIPKTDKIHGSWY